nr:hypothetical protein [Nonomuraea turkmeniaca]
MSDFRRPDPLIRGVPPLLGHVAESNVLDIDEHLVLALLVPDLAAGVARIDDDRPDGALGPGNPVTVPVLLPILRRRAWNPILGEPFGDGEDSFACAELSEDAPDYVARRRMRCKAVEPFAVRGFAGVRVRAQVNQAVAVRRPSTQVSPFHLRQRRHG